MPGIRRIRRSTGGRRRGFSEAETMARIGREPGPGLTPGRLRDVTGRKPAGLDGGLWFAKIFRRTSPCSVITGANFYRNSLWLACGLRGCLRYSPVGSADSETASCPVPRRVSEG